MILHPKQISSTERELSVLVAVSCQANLELPSDLVTDQRRSGGERDDRVDDDRFSDDEEDRVLRGIGEVCVAASRLEGAMAFLAMTMQN